MVRVISNITKEYPDMIKVVIFREPRIFSEPARYKRNREEIEENYTPKISSLNRTKTLLKDIVLCNDFELFCTFTFNPKKIDRYNFRRCQQAMRTWLHHQRDNATRAGKEFKYIIVPEQHKDGAWHFHALISGYVGSLRDSSVRTKTLRPVYNITSFRSGFTTAVEIDSKEGVSEYVTKYITKDFIQEFNQRRFFCSRNLTRPIREVNSSIFRNTLPVFRRKISSNHDSDTFAIDFVN